MLAPFIWGEEVRHCWRIVAAPRSIIAYVGPDPALLDPAILAHRLDLWIENPNWRVVGVQPGRREHAGLDLPRQRAEHTGRLAAPVDQGRARNISAEPGKDLALPVQRPSDRRTWPPECVPASRARPCRARSAGLAQPVGRSSRIGDRISSGAPSRRSSAWRRRTPGSRRHLRPAGATCRRGPDKSRRDRALYQVALTATYPLTSPPNPLLSQDVRGLGGGVGR